MLPRQRIRSKSVPEYAPRGREFNFTRSMREQTTDQASQHIAAATPRQHRPAKKTMVTRAQTAAAFDARHWPFAHHGRRWQRSTGDARPFTGVGREYARRVTNCDDIWLQRIRVDHQRHCRSRDDVPQ